MKPVINLDASEEERTAAGDRECFDSPRSSERWLGRSRLDDRRMLILSDLSRGVSWFDVKLLSFATLVFMIGSGYLITTAIVGVLLRGRSPWLYPMIAASLFVIHEQFFLTGWGHLRPAEISACLPPTMVSIDAKPDVLAVELDMAIYIHGYIAT